jgi:hypothetical protein
MSRLAVVGVLGRTTAGLSTVGWLYLLRSSDRTRQELQLKPNALYVWMCSGNLPRVLKPLSILTAIGDYILGYCRCLIDPILGSVVCEHLGRREDPQSAVCQQRAFFSNQTAIHAEL